MEKIDDGKGAFPIRAVEFSDGSTVKEHVGMSLRDYFAAAAITGAAAMRDRLNDTELAMDGYAIADAMLKARGET